MAVSAVVYVACTLAGIGALGIAYLRGERKARGRVYGKLSAFNRAYGELFGKTCRLPFKCDRASLEESSEFSAFQTECMMLPGLACGNGATGWIMMEGRLDDAQACMEACLAVLAEKGEEATFAELNEAVRRALALQAAVLPVGW